ncbi:hypothetical protein EXS54_00310 [Patescibacteria group bacterium]|nr:hypothetical protein [Patescibacteria group bacterium]
MPNPIPSPLRSILNWFKGSHLRLLLSGLAIVTVISAVSLFAGGATVGSVAPGDLPKAGQAGLIVFITFLIASAVYYGGRRYLAKRNK